MNATKSYIYGGEPVVWPTEQEAADAAHRVVACLTEAGHPRSRAVTMFVEAEDAYTFCVDTDAPRALVDKAHRVAGVDLEEVLWVPTGTFDAYLNTWLPPLLDDEAAG